MPLVLAFAALVLAVVPVSAQTGCDSSDAGCLAVVHIGPTGSVVLAGRPPPDSAVNLYNSGGSVYLDISVACQPETVGCEAGSRRETILKVSFSPRHSEVTVSSPRRSLGDDLDRHASFYRGLPESGMEVMIRAHGQAILRFSEPVRAQIDGFLATTSEILTWTDLPRESVCAVHWTTSSFGHTYTEGEVQVTSPPGSDRP